MKKRCLGQIVYWLMAGNVIGERTMLGQGVGPAGLPWPEKWHFDPRWKCFGAGP